MTMRVTADGQWVSAEFQRIAQVIHDYDENLELAWVPPNMREINEEYPYAVIHTNPDGGARYVVMRLRETEVDHRVIARLWGADSRNQNALEVLEKEEAARQAVEMLAQEDAEEERRELAAWMVKAPTGTKMGNGVVLR